MSHYNNEFEPCAMIIYSAIIFNAIESFKLCYQKDAIFFQWVKLEVVVFTSSVLGIFVLMGLKTIMRKLRTRLQFSVKDLKTTVLTDALSQHHWDVILTQVAVTNCSVAVFICAYMDGADCLYVTAVGGGCQVILMLCLFIIPANITNPCLKSVKVSVIVIFDILGCFLLPIGGFIWGLCVLEKSSMSLLW